MILPMKDKANQPKTLQAAIVYFSDPDRALDYMVRLRWPDGVVACPACGRTDSVFLKNQRKWQCKSVHAKRQFSTKVGTIFEDSPIALEKWLTVVWMLVNCKNGISSYEVAKAIGVTQKSAWFMLHRIRKALQTGFSGKTGRPRLRSRSRRNVRWRQDRQYAQESCGSINCAATPQRMRAHTVRLW